MAVCNVWIGALNESDLAWDNSRMLVPRRDYSKEGVHCSLDCVCAGLYACAGLLKSRAEDDSHQ